MAHTIREVIAGNFCDDVFAETADVVFGDAWLSQYTDESVGKSVLSRVRDAMRSILRRG